MPSYKSQILIQSVFQFSYLMNATHLRSWKLCFSEFREFKDGVRENLERLQKSFLLCASFPAKACPLTLND